MYYIVDSDKSFEQASSDLEAAVDSLGFKVLHVHDLGVTLRGKGIDFPEDCRVFEVCNPVQAARVLGTDMRLNMALPCRISVYTEDKAVKIGLIKPREMLTSLSDDPDLLEVAQEVEDKTIEMINAAS